MVPGHREPHWTDVADMTQGFHTYAVDWEPDKITWYFDGQQTFETPTTPDMNQPMYVLATTDTGLSGSWPGATDPSLVSQMKIDYIRVYDCQTIHLRRHADGFDRLDECAGISSDNGQRPDGNNTNSAGRYVRGGQAVGSLDTGLLRRQRQPARRSSTSEPTRCSLRRRRMCS